MKIISAIVVVFVGLLLLGAMGYAGVAIFEYLGMLYQSLEPQVARVTAIASIVAVFCALIISGGLKSGSQNKISSGRVVLYQQLLGHWGKRLKGALSTQGEVYGEELVNLEQALALHGSQKVIAAYRSLQRSAEEEEKTPDELQELLKKLVMEMRADIGRVEIGFDKKDLLGLLLGRR